MSNDEPERSFEIHYSLFLVLCSFVRVEGLEPPCLAASDPKSDTSTNFATPAAVLGLRFKVQSPGNTTQDPALLHFKLFIGLQM